MSESSAKSVDECSCGDDERSCYTSEWMYNNNCNDRIKILEVNKEKVGFAINLQNQLLQQILFLQQQNFCKENSKEKDNVFEIQQIVIQQLEEKINCLVKEMNEQSKLHDQQMMEFKELMNEKLNEQANFSELYNQQIKTFEEKIAKNNFENLKEIYSIQEKLLEKIEEKNNEGVDNKKLKEIKEKIKLLNKESVDKFNEIKQVILDQSETTLNKFSVKQKLIEELKEKLASNENNVDSVQELIGEHSDKLKFLQTQVDVLQNHRDLFGRVDEVERSVFDINDKLTDLSNDLIQLKKENWNRMSYINFGNRWGYVADTFAATQKVPINNNLFTNELGTVKISGDQHVEYIPSEKAKSINNMIRVYGQFKFNKEAAEPTCNSLFYFEVKFNIVKKQSEKVDMASIGVDSINGIVTFVSSMMPDNCPKCVYICCSKYGKIRFPEETWKDGDVCGCGVVLPPKSFSDKKPYIFFTKNGKLFGKAVALENIADLFRPFIGVHSCTVDGNFGEDLEKKPFLYDTTKHVTPTIFKVKEFDLVAKYA